MRNSTVSTESSAITWPNTTERVQIASANEKVTGGLEFVGALMVPFSRYVSGKPTTHGEDYFSRKSCYAIKGLVVCNQIRRVRYLSQRERAASV